MSAPPTSDDSSSSSSLGEYTVSCHCGRVSARILASRTKLIVWECSCSDCAMRRNLHFVIPASRIFIDDENAWHDATTLYQWGSRTAIRRFCKTCGILAWYTPRSNPDGVAVTLPCVDFGDDNVNRPEIEVQPFDGRHWEASFAASAIAEESKTSSNEK